nr:mediator of RNA polymerase II transcription subunit 23-like [Crassostrea gigas]
MEEQFLYVSHLVEPFLQRLHYQWTRSLMELVVELYEILVNVDKSCDHLRYLDPITDFLYHIKYMFVGDSVKNEIEKIIRNFRQALTLRRRQWVLQSSFCGLCVFTLCSSLLRSTCRYCHAPRSVVTLLTDRIPSLV